MTMTQTKKLTVLHQMQSEGGVATDAALTEVVAFLRAYRTGNSSAQLDAQDIEACIGGSYEARGRATFWAQQAIFTHGFGD